MLSCFNLFRVLFDRPSMVNILDRIIFTFFIWKISLLCQELYRNIFVVKLMIRLSFINAFCICRLTLFYLDILCYAHIFSKIHMLRLFFFENHLEFLSRKLFRTFLSWLFILMAKFFFFYKLLEHNATVFK